MSEKKKTKAPARKKSGKTGKAQKKVAPKRKTAAKAKPKPAPAPVYEHFFDNPQNVKRTIHALFAVSGILFVLDFFVDRHGDHPWESIFGFYAIYGFVACVILVLVAKELRKVLMRGEDYYDE